ncbi:hypothetical protein BKD09_44770 [Bradyrhizobium japonicum]|uniref:Uncharacterized protein n=2 Tax=Bradyrhizobium japonicum TaxID=375 RepID=A0A1L3FQ78_BRAJP|nr:hypothetical protein BKD09_44770 [Bradyrhizobium japonicum]
MMSTMRLRRDMGKVVSFPGHYFSRDFSFKVCERCDGISDGLTTHCPGVSLPPLVGCNVAAGLLNYDERCGGWHWRVPWLSHKPV